MLLDGIIELLTNDPAVNGLIDGRAYKSVLPRGYTLPACAVHRYGGTQDYNTQGPVSLREDQVQVDYYAASADDAQKGAEAVRALMVGYVGTLREGTVVRACYLERDMDMPYLPYADSKGIANRSLLGFRIVSEVR